MPVKGRKPGAPGVSRNRHAPAHTWTEVDDAPFDGGPELPKHRARGKPWPDGIAAKWDAWRSMPQRGCGRPATGSSRWTPPRPPAGLAAELRNREKVLGTTLDYRRDLRIRYTEPASSPPAGVTNLDQYRDL